ncbi:MAG: hypothetical protein JKX82_00540 [Oleispira sp.]|nr:hypothetical protein [Oleispira sp.]
MALAHAELKIVVALWLIWYGISTHKLLKKGSIRIQDPEVVWRLIFILRFVILAVDENPAFPGWMLVIHE